MPLAVLGLAAGPVYAQTPTATTVEITSDAEPGPVNGRFTVMMEWSDEALTSQRKTSTW